MVEQSKGVFMEKDIVEAIAVEPASKVQAQAGPALEAQAAGIQSGGQFKIIAVKEVISDDSFIAPGDNMKLVAFDILIDNTNGKIDIDFNIFMGTIEVRDSQGYSYTPDFMNCTLTKPSMDPNATIEAGDLMRGWITVAIKGDSSIDGIRVRLKTVTGQSGWVTIRTRVGQSGWVTIQTYAI
jgi:hypothetical protein